jgi:hypothetical protein
MFLLDPLTGEIKGENGGSGGPIPLGDDFGQRRAIVDAKLFENTLVFRDTQNRF